MPSLTKKIVNGKPYYYLRECRRVNGRPKIVWTVYLGSPQALFERLTRPEPEAVDLFEFGASAAAYDIATKLDLVATIDRHVPKQGSQGPSVGEYLLLAALNRCVAPRSKARIADWYGKTVLRRLLPMSPAQLTSQRFWDNMDRVGSEQIVAIERDLAKTAVERFKLDLRGLLFDATNFYTFVDSFNDRATLPQRGHSKEGRANLRIVGLALLVTADGDVPLFHQAYAGNQADAVTFRSVIDEIANRCRTLAQGACDITLVFDKGNNAEDNLESAAKGPFHFVGSLVPTHYPKLLAIPRTEMSRLRQDLLPSVWSVRRRLEVFGVERVVLCTYNRPLFVAQHKTLRREIAKRRRKLKRLRIALQRARERARGKKPTLEGTRKRVSAILTGRHMQELFRTKLSAGAGGYPTLAYEFREKAWKKLSNTLLGKTILFTDREDWTDEQIVRAYRGQAHVEAAFRRMKDPRFLTFRPTHHWTDQKLRVHALYCVIALMLLSLLRRELQNKGVRLSIVRMMEKLAEIREVAILYPSPAGATEPFLRTTPSRMDEEQRRLFDTLELGRFL